MINKDEVCKRCLGIPNAFSHYPNTNNGKCFACNGTGKMNKGTYNEVSSHYKPKKKGVSK